MNSSLWNQIGTTTASGGICDMTNANYGSNPPMSKKSMTGTNNSYIARVQAQSTNYIHDGTQLNGLTTGWGQSFAFSTSWVAAGYNGSKDPAITGSISISSNIWHREKATANPANSTWRVGNFSAAANAYSTDTIYQAEKNVSFGSTSPGSINIKVDWAALTYQYDYPLAIAYGAVQTQPSSPTTINIVRISQTPTNITSSNLNGEDLNISYNTTNITSGTPYLSYKVNSSTSDVMRYINGTAIGGWQNTTGSNVSSVFNYTLDDHAVYPFTANLNVSDFETTVHNGWSLPNGTSVIATQLLNVSNSSSFSFLMVMANGSTASALRYYYCNSTYNFASNAFTSPNCALFGTIPSNTAYNGTHGNSSFILVPMPINATSGTISGTSVKVSPTSYILIRGAAAAANSHAWYINETSRAGATLTSADSGAVWTNQTFTADLHLHQFDGTTTIYYQEFANVSGALNNSTVFSQLFGIAQLPPTSPVVLTPAGGLQYGSINITWVPAQNFTPATITYNVSLLNPDLTFNKTITNNTSAAFFVWNSVGTPQADYVIMVNATDNFTQSAFGLSEQFSLATFNATLLLPTDLAVLSGNQTLLQYSTNNVIAGANCTINVDGANVNSQYAFNSTNSYVASVSNGTHSWFVACTSNDTLFTFTTATRTFSLNFSSFAFTVNLTSAPANVYSSPQGLFFDSNGSLNVLYFTDESTGPMLWIKTIFQNNTTATYNLSYAKTNNFQAVFRDPNGTLILTFNAGGNAVLLKPDAGGTITPISATFPYTNVGNNTQYDAYTYANTEQYQNLALTNASYFFFMVPLTNGSGYFQKMANNTTITQVGAQLPGSISAAWQTIANDSLLTTWYYLATGGTNISLGYYNGSVQSTIATLDVGYTAAQLNTSIGNFYEYGGKKYVMLSNLANTTIYSITDNKTYQFAEQLASPSFIFFVDSDTFLFFNTAGSTTNAYSCYFAGAATCTKFTAAEYGIVMPYQRGTLTTMKRDGNSDVVARGAISSGSVVQLLYNQNTYDAKYRCFDEMAETRDMFKVSIYTDTSSNILLNQSWGYVIPSASIGPGLIKSYFLCTAGTQRLFFSGLTSNFTINAYSLLNTSGAYYTFQVLNQYNIPIQDAQITAYRFSNLNQAFVPIEQGITDFNGNAQFFLEPQAFYKFVIVANGYVVLNFDFTPGAITSLTVRLNQQGGVIPTIPSFEQVFNDVSYSLTPADAYHNDSFNITYVVASNSSALQYFGMNITYNNNGSTTQVFFSNVSGPSGGTMQYTAINNGTYYVSYWFKQQNYTDYTPLPKTYYLFPKVGLASVRGNIATQISGWAYFFFALLIALLCAGWAIRNAGFNSDGAGAFGIAVLWVAALLNPNALVITSPPIMVWMATAALTLLVLGGLLWKQYAA